MKNTSPQSCSRLQGWMMYILLAWNLAQEFVYREWKFPVIKTKFRRFFPESPKAVHTRFEESFQHQMALIKEGVLSTGCEGVMRFKARQSHHRPLPRETTKQSCVRKRLRYAFFFFLKFFSGNQFGFYCRLLYSGLIGALNSSCAHSSRSFRFTFHTIIALILFKLITRQRLKGSYLLPCMCWDPWKSRSFYIPLAGPGTFSTDFGFSVYCSDCAFLGQGLIDAKFFLFRVSGQTETKRLRSPT